MSSVARICRTAGLSRLKNLEPPAPAIRYEREHPGELLHVDTKRLGRFDRVGHYTQTVVRLEEARVRVRVRSRGRCLTPFVRGGARGRA
jgi:hypothetical protein